MLHPNDFAHLIKQIGHARDYHQIWSYPALLMHVGRFHQLLKQDTSCCNQSVNLEGGTVTLPLNISSLSHQDALTKVHDLSTENEQLKTDLRQYKEAIDVYALVKKSVHIFQGAFLQLIPDTAMLLVAVLSLWLVHFVFNHFVGNDAKFFDWIPISYFFDAAHISVLLKFFLFLIKDFGFRRSQ